MSAKLSPEVLAVHAELLARGVVALGESRPRKGPKILFVASALPEWAEAAVPDLLDDSWEIDWLGETPRRIVPRRILEYGDRGMGGLKVTLVLQDEEHVDEVLIAEDDDKIVLAAFVCSPALPTGGPSAVEAIKKYAARDLAGRPVIDRFTGEVLQNWNAPGQVIEESVSRSGD